MNKLLKLALLVFASIICMSCIKDDGRSACEECGGTLEFTVKTAQDTKSSYDCSEDLITSCHILIYSGNNLVAYRSFQDDPRGVSYVFRLPKGSSYDCYAVANVDGFDPKKYEKLDNLLHYSLDIDGKNFDRYGFPMVWTCLTYINLDKTKKITIELERLVSRWEFNIDLSELPALTVNSVRIANVATRVKPFVTYNQVTNDDGDQATAEDIRYLNGGKTVVFYVPENLQGNLLAGNSDPYQKNYFNLCNKIGAERANRCTYLELTGDFDPNADGGEPLYTGSITYRFYLGGNDTSNFDIVRNTVNKITLTPTLRSPEAIRPDGGAIVWKAEPDVTKHEYRVEYILELSKSSLSKDGESFTASVSAQRFKDGEKVGVPVDVSDSFSFSSDDKHVNMNGNNGTLSASAGDNGSATITARDKDGNSCSAIVKWDIEDVHVPVITTETRVYIKLDPEDMGPSRGEFSARIISEKRSYKDGKLDRIDATDITSGVGSLKFTTSNQYVTVNTKGEGELSILAEKAGQARISATGTEPASYVELDIEDAVLVWDDALVTFEYSYHLVVNEVTYDEAGGATMTKRGRITGYIKQEARKFVNGTLVSGPYETNISSSVTDLVLSCHDAEVGINYAYIDGSRFQIGVLNTSHISGNTTIFAEGKLNGKDIAIVPGILIWNFTRN